MQTKQKAAIFTRRSCFRTHEFIQMGLNPTDIVVYMNLVERADKFGTCYPSLNRIACDCGLKTRTTVSKAIKNLELSGLIVKTNRYHEKSGGQRSNTYTINEISCPKNYQGGVDKTDHKETPNPNKNKKEVLSLEDWSPSPEMRAYFSEKMPNKNFLSYVNRYKKKCKEIGYDYSYDWNDGLRQWIDKYVKTKSQAKALVTHSKPKKPLMDIELVGPTSELNSEQNALWTACLSVLPTNLAKNTVAEFIHNLKIVEMERHETLRIIGKKPIPFGVEHTLNQHKNALEHFYFQNKKKSKGEAA